jgi:hypothetical protein
LILDSVAPEVTALSAFFLLVSVAFISEAFFLRGRFNAPCKWRVVRKAPDMKIFFDYPIQFPPAPSRPPALAQHP